MAAGSSMLATIRTAPPQWIQWTHFRKTGDLRKANINLLTSLEVPWT